jgi:hypothetical protein
MYKEVYPSKRLIILIYLFVKAWSTYFEVFLCYFDTWFLTSKEEDISKKVEPKNEDEGGGPSEPSSPSSSSTRGHYSHNKTTTKKSPHAHNFPLLKLDVKFELQIYDGELNAKKLDNWINQIEVYCRVQNIMDEIANIQLDTLHLGDTTLIWWESKTQVHLIQHGKVISSWDEFIVANRKQFYPLAYVRNFFMEWKHL